MDTKLAKHSFYIGLLLLTGCKIEVTPSSHGSVKSTDGSFYCDMNSQCVINVSDIHFDQTFIAEPYDDRAYEFVGWNVEHKSLCGGSAEPCALSTADFSNNDALMSVLESDEIFYLKPTFERKRAIAEQWLTGTWIFTSNVDYTSTNSAGTSDVVKSERFSVGINGDDGGKAVAVHCLNDSIDYEVILAPTDNQLVVYLGRERIILDFVDDTHLEGRYDYAYSERRYRSSSVSAIKIDNRTFGGSGFSFGNASIDIATTDGRKDSSMPVGCFAKGEKDGVFSGNSFSSEYLIFFAFRNSLTKGPWHSAELTKYSTIDDVSASFALTADSLWFEQLLVSGDGNGEDMINFTINGINRISGNYSAYDENDNSSTVTGSFNIHY